MPVAVVVGSGLAGLCAAAALAPRCDRVTIIDRDVLPDGPEPRRGVPQGEQLHNLLSRGQHELERLVPGVLSLIEKRSAGRASVATDTHVFEMGGEMPRRDLGMALLCVERPAIEHELRALILARWGHVDVRSSVTAAGLDVRRGRLRGVATAGHDGVPGAALEADLVVDATGPSAQAISWLDDLDLAPPPTETSMPDQWYASVRVRSVATDGDAPFAMAFPPPGESRGALLSPVGGGGWYVSVNGRSHDPIPTTFDELLAYTGSLADPTIHRRLVDAIPTGPLSRYRRAVATWRRYDRMSAPVPGLLAVGDSVASLNPLFGQGISTAAWGAREMGEALRRWCDGQMSLADATRDAHHNIARIVDQVWELGRAVDGGILGDDPGDVASRGAAFVDALRRDPGLHRRYVEVWHLMRPVDQLDLPATLAS